MCMCAFCVNFVCWILLRVQFSINSRQLRCTSCVNFILCVCMTCLLRVQFSVDSRQTRDLREHGHVIVLRFLSLFACVVFVRVYVCMSMCMKRTEIEKKQKDRCVWCVSTAVALASFTRKCLELLLMERDRESKTRALQCMCVTSRSPF